MKTNYKTSKDVREKANQYYWKNRKKCLAKQKAYSHLYKEIKKKYDKEKYERNREKIKEKQKLYYHRNRPKAKQYRLQKLYGISLKDYKNKWNEQKGQCAICHIKSYNIEEMFNRVLVLDHDHNTNQVRGLLCNSCNRGLGLLNDDPLIISNAFNYLNQWKQNYVSSKCY